MCFTEIYTTDVDQKVAFLHLHLADGFILIDSQKHKQFVIRVNSICGTQCQVWFKNKIDR